MSKTPSASFDDPGGVDDLGIDGTANSECTDPSTQVSPAPNTQAVPATAADVHSDIIGTHSTVEQDGDPPVVEAPPTESISVAPEIASRPRAEEISQFRSVQQTRALILHLHQDNASSSDVEMDSLPPQASGISLAEASRSEHSLASESGAAANPLLRPQNRDRIRTPLAEAARGPLHRYRYSKATLFFVLPGFALAFIINLLFAYNATITDPLKGPKFPPFIVGPESTVFLLHLLSGIAIFLSLAINSTALTTIRWAFAVKDAGVPLLTFITLSPSTGPWGLIRLAIKFSRSPRRLKCYTRRHWWLFARYVDVQFSPF